MPRFGLVAYARNAGFTVRSCQSTQSTSAWYVTALGVLFGLRAAHAIRSIAVQGGSGKVSAEGC